MTSDHFPQTWSGRIVEAAKIVGAVSILASTTFGLWALVYGPVGQFFDRIDLLVADVAQLKTDVARATGDDRVIRQTAGQSYVEEPVYEGDHVTMIMVASRTKLGMDCRLTEWTPLFTDEGGITIPGAPARDGPVRRQITDEQTRLRIDMLPPEGLQPGRVELYLTLTYACGADGRVVYDRTDPVFYELIAGPKPKRG